MVHSRRPRRLFLFLLLATGLATGAACAGSGSGSTNGVASIRNVSNEGESAAGGQQDGEKKNPEDAMLEFARCMRENGVDMPDPDTSGGPGVVTFRAGPSGSSASVAGQEIDVDRETFQKAHEACKDLMADAGPVNMTPEKRQEMQDQALAFARCMREQGINMPDPTFGDQGQVMTRLDPSMGVDPEDPKFQEAQKACGAAFGPAGARGRAGAVSGGGGSQSGTVFSAPDRAINPGGGAK